MKLVLLALVVVGCGDNSDECGPGTTSVYGVCTPTGGVTCGPGTVLEPGSGACVPDPSVCGDGTVLIGGTCQDPNAGVTVDLEEGPEPNGFERGAAAAGIITLKPVGDPSGFVIHGCITPTGDTADFDRYVLTVTGPTLVDITSAGIDGLDGGFVALDATDAYQRFGLDVVNATSEREVYFPQQGTYSVVIADSRTLLGILDADDAPPAGNPDGTSCYYVTLQQKTPAPMPISLPAGNSGTIAGKLQFFSAAPGVLPNGFIDLTETIGANEALPSLQILQNGQLRMIRDAVFTSDAEAIFGGILPADSALVVVDYVFDYAIAPAPFTLGVASATTAQALPTAGTTATAMTAGTTGQTPSTTNLFYVDTLADDMQGLVVALSQPMEGAIVDADYNAVVDFGGLFGSAGAYEVFSAYQGLVRMHDAGRYYLALYGPASPVGTSYTVTSTFHQVFPPQLLFGSEEPATSVALFNQLPYTFEPEDTPWGSLNAIGVNSGNVSIALFDFATAFGRLAAVQLSNGTTTATSPGAPTLIAPFVVPPDGSAPHEYIFASFPEDELLVIASAATAGASATVALDPEIADYIDLGTLAAGDTSRAGDTSPQRYFAMAPKSADLGIGVSSATALTIATLNPDETIAMTAAGVNPNLDFAQDVRGYTAFEVTGGPATFGLTVNTVYPFYVDDDSSTLFADACLGSGLDITPLDTDEGITAPFSVPLGFTFYGLPAGQLVASTNGFLSFNTALADAHPDPSVLPVTDVHIAPFWQDLSGVQICEQTVNGALVVQWTGGTVAGGTAVQFQAILDPATSSIEYVFGPNHAEPGTELNLGGHAAIQGVGAVGTAQVTLTGNGSVEAFALEGTLLSH